MIPSDKEQKSGKCHKENYFSFVGGRKITYRSPQEPDAILSPIFNNLLSISQSPDFPSVANAFSTAEWELEERDHDPYIPQEGYLLHFYWHSSFTYMRRKKDQIDRDRSALLGPDDDQKAKALYITTTLTNI
jgi:hypothetical protein